MVLVLVLNVIYLGVFQINNISVCFTFKYALILLAFEPVLTQTPHNLDSS